MTNKCPHHDQIFSKELCFPDGRHTSLIIGCPHQRVLPVLTEMGLKLWRYEGSYERGAVTLLVFNSLQEESHSP